MHSNPPRDRALNLKPQEAAQSPQDARSPGGPTREPRSAFERQKPYQIGALVSMVGAGAGLCLGVMALMSGREGDGAAMIAVGLVMGAASALLFSLAGRKK
jgi:hypothetical protein